MNYKTVKLLVIITLVVMLFTLIRFISLRSKVKINIVNSEKIKLNMTKEQVLKIMGEPESKQLSYFNKLDTMYYYKPPFGASSGIYIQFDDSLRIVNRITLYE